MNNISERRGKPRVICNYPVIIEGHDMTGSKYSEKARLNNLSASGLYMKAYRRVENGSKLAVTVLLTDETIDEATPKIATNGVVVRIEPQLDGSCGIAVKFTNYRFL